MKCFKSFILKLGMRFILAFKFNSDIMNPMRKLAGKQNMITPNAVGITSLTLQLLNSAQILRQNLYL